MVLRIVVDVTISQHLLHDLSFSWSQVELCMRHPSIHPAYIYIYFIFLINYSFFFSSNWKQTQWPTLKHSNQAVTKEMWIKSVHLGNSIFVTLLRYFYYLISIVEFLPLTWFLIILPGWGGMAITVVIQRGVGGREGLTRGASWERCSKRRQTWKGASTNSRPFNSYYSMFCFVLCK